MKPNETVMLIRLYEDVQDLYDHGDGALPVKVRVGTKLYDLVLYDGETAARIEEPMQNQPGGGPYFVLLEATATDEELEG